MLMWPLLYMLRLFKIYLYLDCLWQTHLFDTESFERSSLFYGHGKHPLQVIWSEHAGRFYLGFEIWGGTSPQESSVDTGLLWTDTWWCSSGLVPSSASWPYFQPSLSSHPQIPKQTLVEWTSWQVWDYGLLEPKEWAHTIWGSQL